MSMEIDASQARKTHDAKELIYWKLVVLEEPVEFMLKVQKCQQLEAQMLTVP